ncbi:MAG: class I SAM-dependent methyltransferase [Cyanobacteria bacterium P01_C01_bin.69]
MAKISVDLGPVQETLLIPLLGRALETKKGTGLIQDQKAVEIVKALDYDFSKWRKSQSLVGATLRTRLFDQDVQQFLMEHPTGTVIEIGCGLNTRFERIDNGRAHWFDLDLADSLALRRQFFQDQPRRTMLEASVLETDWMAVVAATGGPWCFVSEAVIIYLEPTQARQAISQIANRFPGAWILTDTTAQAMVDSQSSHDAMKYMSQESWFRWGCDDPSEIESWADLHLTQSRTFLDADPELIKCAPLPTRLAIRWAPWLIRRKVDGYRLNRFIVNSNSKTN